jgi:predicted dehydrogenase
MLRIGLIGCGRQGWRRAPAIRQNGDQLIVVADDDGERAKVLADEMRCEVTTDWKSVIARKDIDAVVICTPNIFHAPMSIAALENKKHVLCEKPLGRNPEETQQIVDVVKKTGMILKCGFNIRHHPGVQQARKWFEQGAIGKISFIRARYGIGGRMDYDKDWRADKNVSGGGQLMDQGMHVLDLLHWFLGDFTEAVGFLSTAFWQISPLEDNAFCLLRTEKNQVASIHVSWTQWKNLFSLEIFGQDGYIIIDGLGGSYGVERAILGKRNFSKPFEEKVIEFRGEDISWREEWKEFLSAINENREPLGSAYDGLEAVKLAFAIYDSAAEKRVVKITKTR